MKAEKLSEALEVAAAAVGLKVRYETMTGETAGAAGLCRVRGVWNVIMDRKTQPSERVSILAQALTGFDLEGVFLPPEAREAVDAQRARAGATATLQ